MPGKSQRSILDGLPLFQPSVFLGWCCFRPGQAFRPLSWPLYFRGLHTGPPPTTPCPRTKRRSFCAHPEPVPRSDHVPVAQHPGSPHPSALSPFPRSVEISCLGQFWEQMYSQWERLKAGSVMEANEFAVGLEAEYSHTRSKPCGAAWGLRRQGAGHRPVLPSLLCSRMERWGAWKCNLWSKTCRYCKSTYRGRRVSSVQFICSVMSDSSRPHGLQHARLPCPSSTPRAYSNSCPSSRWCHPTILSSLVPFSSAFNLSQHQGRRLG